MKLMVGDTVIIAKHPDANPALVGELAEVKGFGPTLPSSKKPVHVEYKGELFGGTEGYVNAEALVIKFPDCDCRAAELNSPAHSVECNLQVFVNKHKRGK